jgi:hypothetical protein
VSQVISDLSLDANDPAVIEALRGTYRNRDHFEAAMGRMALQKVNRKQPSPSAAPSGQTGNATPSQDAQSAYESKMSNIVQTMRGDAKQRAIAELRVWARKEGIQNV